MTLDPFVERRRKVVPKHPQITTAARTKLACFPASILAFVVDSQDRLLLLRRPGQPGWEVVSSPLQAGESVPDALERAVREHVGGAFQGVFLGVLDAYTFVFDANLPAAMNVCALMRYRGGELRPGRDVRDAEFRWWAVIDLDQIDLAVPRSRWDLLTKAADMARSLRDARPEEDSRHLEEPEDDREGWR